MLSIAGCKFGHFDVLDEGVPRSDTSDQLRNVPMCHFNADAE